MPLSRKFLSSLQTPFGTPNLKTKLHPRVKILIAYVFMLNCSVLNVLFHICVYASVCSIKLLYLLTYLLTYMYEFITLLQPCLRSVKWALRAPMFT